MNLWKEPVNHTSKTISAIYMGTIAYTKPLFRLVKCMMLAFPCPGTSILMQCLDGLEVRWCRSRDHVLPVLKRDEFQRCPDSMVIGSFFPVESE